MPSPTKAGSAQPNKQATAPPATEPMRIAKAIARAGLCSRRDAERWIADGRVKINGKILTTPARTVSDNDNITVDGKPLPTADPVRLWRYHKPKGLVTTHRDTKDRPTIFEALPGDVPRVISVGRLDINTEGLLLLTNDGALARHLELPSTGWLRRYRVRAKGRLNQSAIDRLADGITIDRVRYGPIEVAVDTVQGANTWLTFGLREGKNREIRKVLEHFGLQVNRLIRISYGPFQLHDLAPKETELVKRKVLIEQLGGRLAHQLKITDEVKTSRPRARPTAKRTPQKARNIKPSATKSAAATKPARRPRQKN